MTLFTKSFNDEPAEDTTPAEGAAPDAGAETKPEATPANG